MYKGNFFIHALVAMTFWARSVSAQITLSGTISDAQSGAALEASLVSIEGTGQSNITGPEGSFRFNLRKPGSYRIQVRIIGYLPQIQSIQLRENTHLEIKLEPADRLSEEVIISATRSKEKDPTTSTTLTDEDLKKVNLGQDLPVLLQMAPSVLTTSDAGAGVGYTGINIRGSDATRINVTVNGVPLNDAESQGVFWVNMPDFASSVSSIQMQRGVGTSTNGPSAFGASLNIQTNTLQNEAYAETSNSIGSFKTLKNNLMAGTGLMDGKWAVDVRLSRISSNGFIDRAASDLASTYISGGYYGKKGLLKFNLMHGREKTYQAWNGIPESRLRGDRQAMEDYAIRNGLSETETAQLVNSSSRTYNPFTYKDQTDNYKQTHYQLFYSNQLTNIWSVNSGLFYTKGAGYYQEFKAGERFSKYGLENPVIGGDTLDKTDLIRQRWLDNDFFGATYSLQYQSDNLSVTLGGLASQYRGDHFGDVVWARVSNLNNNAFRYYENDARKSDLNHYLKATLRVTKTLSVYADVQVRALAYRFQGYDRNLNLTNQTADFVFINPKAGLSFQVNGEQQLYVSYGKSSHEPARVDFINSSPESRPRAEILHNGELGWRWTKGENRASVNGYLMYYKDQLVLTGQINDVGAYIRSNVDESYRVGVEAEGSFALTQGVRIFGNATLSRNRIISYSYFLDDYDQGGQKETQYKNAPIAFSPDLIAAAGVSAFPLKNWEAALESKWVGRQYLDNTGSKDKSINPYNFVNFRTSYTVYAKGFKQLVFQLMVNNVLDSRYENNGYTYGYVYGGAVVNENFYFPSAGRNFLAGVSLKL